MREEWADITGYEGLYKVSNFGRVKAMPKRVNKYQEKIVKQHIMKNGYMGVILSKDSICKNHLVHRLVAKAFVNNEDEKPVVNHIDYNRQNNIASNLEWCTTSENVKHSSVNNPRTFKDRFLPSTNEKYISRANKRPGYVVYVKQNGGKRPYSYKYFSTLNDAIQFRNEFYGWL